MYFSLFWVSYLGPYVGLRVIFESFASLGLFPFFPYTFQVYFRLFMYFVGSDFYHYCFLLFYAAAELSLAVHIGYFGSLFTFLGLWLACLLKNLFCWFSLSFLLPLFPCLWFFLFYQFCIFPFPIVSANIFFISFSTSLLFSVFILFSLYLALIVLSNLIQPSFLLSFHFLGMLVFWGRWFLGISWLCCGQFHF